MRGSTSAVRTATLITCIVLTLPVVPRDRWFICCVIGPIMLAGCMDMVWSMVGVITAPWWRRWRGREWPRRQSKETIHMIVPQRSHQNINGRQRNTSRTPCVIARSFTVRWNMWDSGEHTWNSGEHTWNSVSIVSK